MAGAVPGPLGSCAHRAIEDRRVNFGPVWKKKESRRQARRNGDLFKNIRARRPASVLILIYCLRGYSRQFRQGDRREPASFSGLAKALTREPRRPNSHAVAALEV